MIDDADMNLSQPCLQWMAFPHPRQVVDVRIAQEMVQDRNAQGLPLGRNGEGGGGGGGPGHLLRQCLAFGGVGDEEEGGGCQEDEEDDLGQPLPGCPADQLQWSASGVSFGSQLR